MQEKIVDKVSEMIRVGGMDSTNKLQRDAYDACLACMAILEKENLTKDQLYSLQRWASLVNAKANQMVCEVTGQVAKAG